MAEANKTSPMNPYLIYFPQPLVNRYNYSND